MSDDSDIRERPTDGGRPRAVLSPMDFDLLKEAVGEYIRNLPEDDARSRQFTQLYHRLGRAG